MYTYVHTCMYLSSDLAGVRKPNAVLTWNSECGLGEHTMKLRLISNVAAGKQITINYGPKHRVVPRQPRRARRNKGEAAAPA